MAVCVRGRQQTLLPLLLLLLAVSCSLCALARTSEAAAASERHERSAPLPQPPAQEGQRGRRFRCQRSLDGVASLPALAAYTAEDNCDWAYVRVTDASATVVCDDTSHPPARTLPDAQRHTDDGATGDGEAADALAEGVDARGCRVTLRVTLRRAANVRQLLRARRGSAGEYAAYTAALRTHVATPDTKHNDDDDDGNGGGRRRSSGGGGDDVSMDTTAADGKAATSSRRTHAAVHNKVDSGESDSSDSDRNSDSSSSLHLELNDPWRFTLQLRAPGGGAEAARGATMVHYKGDSTRGGYSVCCDLLQPPHGGDCTWLQAGKGDNDLAADEAPPTRLRMQRIVRHCSLPLDGDEDEVDADDTQAAATATRHGDVVTMHGAVTRPLHRRMGGVWEARLQLQRRRSVFALNDDDDDDTDNAGDGDGGNDAQSSVEVLGRVVVPFVVPARATGDAQNATTAVTPPRHGDNGDL